MNRCKSLLPQRGERVISLLIFSFNMKAVNLRSNTYSQFTEQHLSFERFIKDRNAVVKAQRRLVELCRFNQYLVLDK